MKLLNISGLSLPHITVRLLGSIQKYFTKCIYLIFFFTLLCILCYTGELRAETVKKKEKSIDWFWVFYEQVKYSEGITFVYRPFYLQASNKENLFQASLMPVLFWRYNNERNDVTKGFFGFYESTDYTHPDKNKDYDNGLFPLFLYGSGKDESDKYLFIYPIGGNIRGKMAYDRISPYVFPGIALFFLYPPSGFFTMQTALFALASIIPVYTEFENRDYNGTALFWPLIAWGKGDKRDDFRFLPFYAHSRKDGWYENYSYLLLVNYRELYFSDDARYTFFFFPFYGKKWSKSEKMKSYTVLWPFFSWGYDLDTNERTYNLPWPLVQIGDSDKPKMKKRIFFPFWGRYETPAYESMFVTPLYFRIKDDGENFKSEYNITCFIAWYFKRDYSFNHEYYGKTWRYFKLWPLFNVEWSDSGLYGINVLSLLPFRDTEGYEKLYQPFWTLFEYRVKPDGEKHLGFLLRTYYQVWDKDFFKMKIPVVINYESRGDKVKECTVLLSSFGYKKDNDGTYIKLLWIPLKIGEGDTALADNGSDSDMDLFYYNEELPGYNPYHGNLAVSELQSNFYFKESINF